MRSNNKKQLTPKEKKKKRLRDAYACHNKWFIGDKRPKRHEENSGWINYLFGIVLFIWLIKVWVEYPNV